jgi:hypothetical protein
MEMMVVAGVKVVMVVMVVILVADATTNNIKGVKSLPFEKRS